MKMHFYKIVQSSKLTVKYENATFYKILDWTIFLLSPLLL